MAKKTNHAQTNPFDTWMLDVDGRVVDIPQNQQAKKGLEMLQAAMEQGTYLTGTISGVETLEDNAVAVVYTEGVKVIIPLTHCIDLLEGSGEEKKRSKTDYMNYLLHKRLGSQIDYCPVHVDKERLCAVGDRKRAMAQKRKEYFFGKDKDGSYLLKNGVIVEARIAATARPGITLEVFGVDLFLPAVQLDYQRISDCNLFFNTGDTVLCRLKAIERNENTNEVRLDASVKDALNDPYPAAMGRFVIDGKYIGTVSMIAKEGVYVAMNGGVDILCPMPTHGLIPCRGCRVTVRVTSIVKDANRIFGIIQHVAGV